MAKKRSGTPAAGGKRRSLSSGASSYEVGYGKPPKKAQFKKGVSGNPKGRKAKDYFKPDPLTEIRNALVGPLMVLQGDKKIQMTGFTAVFKKLLERAFKGDDRSIITIVKVIKELGFLIPPKRPPLDATKMTDEELRAFIELHEKHDEIFKKYNPQLD